MMNFVLSEAEYRELLNTHTGLCLDCGAERECTEPDASCYRCAVCGAFRVYGLEVLLVVGRIEFNEVDNGVV